MKNRIDYLLWAGTYLFRTKILRQRTPFIGGLVLNESCNLKCIQCRVANRKLPDLTFTESIHGLQTFFDLGIRSVFIEGGEPYLWKDGEKKVEDVIKEAKKMGFRVVSIYTNGTFPIESSADTIFVSLDGLKETNNRLRGPVFDRVINNITKSHHPNIIVNFTINRLNSSEIGLFCDEMQKYKHVKGIFFYFHTPYYGIDDLFLPLEDRRKIIDRILELKKKGLPILNSAACLKIVKKDSWERPSDTCYVFANNKLFQCCRAKGQENVCANCGYLGYPEILSILSMKPSAILSALQYIPPVRNSS